MTETYDYIVVGAGSAGCVLANRLSEDGKHTVLAIEAGGADTHFTQRMPLGFMAALANPALDWGYRTEPEPNLGGRELPLPRGRILGGCSTINGMIYMRGHALDYDEWRDMGCVGWSYEGVLPYFRRMETSWRGAGRYHGDSGPLPVREVRTSWLFTDEIMQAAENAGFARSDDLGGERQEGVSTCQVTIDRRGRRASAARAYLRPASNRANLRLLLNAHVARVLFEGRRAIGVDYRRGGRIERAQARAEVILCGGAYNSPHLLMLSGVGPGDHLAAHGLNVVAHSLGVGANLSEHPVVYAEFASSAKTFLDELRIDRAALSVLRWALLGSGPFATQATSCAMLMRTAPDLVRPDIQLVFLPIRLDAKIWQPGFGKRLDDLFSVMIIQLHPESRGRVELRSADPFDKPKIALNLLSDPRDYAALRGGIAAVRRIFSASPLAELTTCETRPGAALIGEADLDAFIRENLRITQHPVGTCRMGSDGDAVVDPQLRVNGVEGLRVVDASIMPTVPGGNINAPVIMAAEKASDLIRSSANS